MLTKRTWDDFPLLLELFQKDGKDLEVWMDYNRLFVRSKVTETEFMLRIEDFRQRLTVARICFANKRQGYGTKLIEILKQYGQQYGYKELVFECVLTEEMANFLKKHGFEKIHNPAFEHEFSGDWKIDI